MCEVWVWNRPRVTAREKYPIDLHEGGGTRGRSSLLRRAHVVERSGDANYNGANYNGVHELHIHGWLSMVSSLISFYLQSDFFYSHSNHYRYQPVST